MNTVHILRGRLRRFEFQEAFLELLGWNHARGSSVLEVSGRTFAVRKIAEKGDTRVLEITEPQHPDSEEAPEPRLTAAAGRALRERIAQKARELHGVCVLAFINADRTECYWRFPRADGKPGSYPERRYYRDRTPVDSLLSVLRHLEIPYELQNELGNVPHTDMLERLAQSGARADRVTRKFFKEFDGSRKQFEGFLSWVDDEKRRTWYVTALLNRVMFIYFLQERGLLPDGNQYLARRLAEWQVHGPNRFYREFLLPLCFLGFGTRQGERGHFEETFRGVPYLDGGLFEVHEVERQLGITREAVLAGTLPAAAVIPDAEFERWFGFLGSWRWTLDEETSPEGAANEGQIHPGILGYIFEKYINQKELGAYYTKEDITGYICRSTIIPRLFDMLGEVSGEQWVVGGGQWVVGGERWVVSRGGGRVAPYDLVAELSGLGSLEEINRLGADGLRRLAVVSGGGALRVDQPASPGGSVGSRQHRGGVGEERHGGVPPGPERGEGLPGGSGDPGDRGGAHPAAGYGGAGEPPRTHAGDRQDAGRSAAVTAIQALTEDDFPLHITHYPPRTTHCPLPTSPCPPPTLDIDRYIYGAVKTTEYLPTETDREYAARQERYAGILQDFEEGKIRTINDGITYNLDLEKLARDFVLTIQDPEVLWLFYDRCLKRITILDPAVGSGAFLLAAVNILFPLYQAALDRMEEFCRAGAAGMGLPPLTWSHPADRGEEAPPGVPTPLDGAPETVAAIEEMWLELERIHQEHPNPEYFVYKTIIVNNLFGVDIVEEAVEICKLRLFLKLIAHAAPDAGKPNQGIEPLPDIDFNILAGNSLVGYARLEDIDRGWETVGRLAFEKDHEKLEKYRREYALMLQWYRDAQLGLPTPRPVTKEQVRCARQVLLPEVDQDVWRLHRTANLVSDRMTLEAFLASHRPFHWFLEFPGPLSAGGFDAVVGNPPYVELRTIRGQYGLLGYDSCSSGNLFATFLERAVELAGIDRGRFSLIVPISLLSGDRTESIRTCLMRRTRLLAVSSFGFRPSHLFEGVNHRLAIPVGERDDAEPSTVVSTSSYTLWSSDERPVLLQKVGFQGTTYSPAAIPKYGLALEPGIAAKIARITSKVADCISRDGSEQATVYFNDAVLYWCRFTDFAPVFRNVTRGGVAESSTLKRFQVRDVRQVLSLVSLLNSSLFFWHWIKNSDCRHLLLSDVLGFPVPEAVLESRELREFGAALMQDYKTRSRISRRDQQHTGTIEYQRFFPGRSKPILDQIDTALAKLYGLTGAELDFVLNYDIKYRLGADAAAE